MGLLWRRQPRSLPAFCSSICLLWLLLFRVSHIFRAPTAVIPGGLAARPR